jgi:hypothetical protein
MQSEEGDLAGGRHTLWKEAVATAEREHAAT